MSGVGDIGGDMEATGFEGGCLCGQVRYRASGAPHTPHWCHCAMCRKATGAPAAAWVNFPLDGFRFVAGEPAFYLSSPGIRRGFCALCGGSLCTAEETSDLISILIGSLDDPARVMPDYHIWTESQVPWLTIGDGLPRRPR